MVSRSRVVTHRTRALNANFWTRLDLPEGTEVDLLPLDPGDWLDDDDREALHRALDASEADVAAGRLVDAYVLKEVRSA